MCNNAILWNYTFFKYSLSTNFLQDTYAKVEETSVLEHDNSNYGSNQSRIHLIDILH